MLNEHIYFGVSKHAIKQQRIKESKENNTPYKPIKGIFSKTTLKTYQKACEQFSTYLRTKHPEVKRFENGKPYIEEWLKSLKDSHSAWTLATYGSGVACAFNISKKDIEFDFQFVGEKIFLVHEIKHHTKTATLSMKMQLHFVELQELDDVVY